MKYFGADPIIYLTLAVGLIFTLILGFLTQQTTMMPVYNAVILWPFLIWALRHARIDVAIRLIAFWAVIILVGAVLAGRILGETAQAAVPGSVEFNAAQMQWWFSDAAFEHIEWLPGFLRRAGISLLGSAITAGLAPAIVGARALAILGLWIANLFNAPTRLALLIGAPVWTWAEIIGQILIAAVLAEPIVTGDVNALLSGRRKRLLAIGLAALALAFLTHLLLPAFIQPLLRARVV